MSDEEKTEEPTAKKKQKARNKGQVPTSKELNSWFMLLAGTIFVGAYGGYFMTQLSDNIKVFFEIAHELPRAPSGPGQVMYQAFWDAVKLLAFPFMMFMFIGVASSLAQNGPLWAREAIKPTLSKLNPISGFKKLFGMNSLVEFAKSLFKLVVISLVAYVLLMPYYWTVDHLVGAEPQQIMDDIWFLFIRLMAGVLVVTLILAIIDLVYQRHKHHEDMKMSKQEVKDERKQAEGDPKIKRRLAQLRVEKAQQRMMQAVPRADVVITNPTHYSIALEYKPESMDAPLCLAKGVDDLALRIRETAKENNIEIVENPPLARGLYDAVDVNEMIPNEFYKAVAEVISFVFKKQGKNMK